MWNWMKTFGLLGAMTALMVFLGMVSGAGATGDWRGAMAGMVIMLIIATGVNFGTWFIADTLVIKSTGAKPVPENQLTWLHEDLAEVAKKAGIPKPRLFLVHNPSPNAFATGRSPKKGIVGVHTGLLDLMGRREIKGVLAHEVGHIASRDTLTGAIAATLAGVITFLAYSARYGFGRQRNLIVEMMILVAAPMAAMVLRMMISRTREFAADRRAARLTGDPEGLAMALEALQRGVSRAPMTNDAARNVHHIVNGFGGGLGKLMSTHPPIDQRVAALRAMKP